MVRRGLWSAKETAWFLGGVFPGGKGERAKWRKAGMTTATASKGRPSPAWALIEVGER